MSEFRTQPMIATPTPWHCDDTAIFGEDGVLARIPNHPENGKNWVADAALIVEAVNSYVSLKARIQELVAVLRGYEQWEADIILENECWSGQNLRLTDEIYDRMIELQTMRNAALQKDTTK